MRVGLALNAKVELDVAAVERGDHGSAQVVVGRPERQARNRRALRARRPDRVLHRLAVAEQVRHATEVRRLERAALGLDPERLHDSVEQVRPREVDEVVDRRVLQALDLQLRVGAHVGRDEGRRRNAEHVLGELLLVHQLRAGDAHQLDADAHEADVVDVGGDVRARAREAHPRAVGLRLGEDAVPELCRQAVVDDELGADDAVRLGVAAALEAARLPEQAHLLLEAGDDRVDELLFARKRLLLGERQLLVDALGVDQEGHEARDRIAQHGIEGRADERIDAALELHQREQRVGKHVEEPRARVRGRHRSADVRVHGGPLKVRSRESAGRGCRAGRSRRRRARSRTAAVR